LLNFYRFSKREKIKYNPMSSRSKKTGLPDKRFLKQALIQSFVKLNPATMVNNPVMFTVEAGTLVMMVVSILTMINPNGAQGSFYYNFTITLILLVTLLFANFAEAIAEARGKAQAESLRKTRHDTPANRLLPEGNLEKVSSALLRKGDLFVVTAGEVVPADGEIVEGMASIDESAITGESAPVIREAGGDKSGVTGGTTVLSDFIKVQVTTLPGESFLDNDCIGGRSQ
jgi:K+-transporting ATPase ATPase B chain